MNVAPALLLFGRRGQGKSFLARKLMRHQARVSVWDLMNEHAPMANFYEGDLSGFENFLAASRGKRFAAARYIPTEDVAEEFNGFCRAAFRAGNFVVVVEEAAEICSPSNLPPAFGRVIRQGRHQGLGLLATTQRLAEVSRTLTSQTDVFVGFSTTEPRDLDELRKRTSAEYVEKVRALPPHQWLAWDAREQAEHTDLVRLLATWGAPSKWT